MATPSSSATTPSPQLRHTQPHTLVAAATTVPNGPSPDDKEERDKAVQKFLARAEIGKITRGLRTRLSYATFKAMHNLTHNTLRDLENDPQSQVRVSKPGNYYNNPATQGNSAMTPGGSIRSLVRKGSMAPPPPVTASAAQSLFSSILAPPPAKRARTIHNPEDPPVAAPVKARNPSPPPRSRTKSSRAADGTQPKSKGRKAAKEKDGVKGKGKQQAVHDLEESADVDIDMKAAATLTSLLLSSRPSMSVGASSPRSSISAGSDSGSTQSYAQYAQSSARTVTAATSSLSESSFTMSHERPSTPPPPSPPDSMYRENYSQPSLRLDGKSTPKQTRRRVDYPAGKSGTPHPPSDTEAASSLLYLATSPSPVRATNMRERDTRDMPSYRPLGGGSGLKGRVLFPTASGGDDTSFDGSRALRRDDSGSFASTVSTSSEFNPDGSFPTVYNKHPVSRPISRSSPTIPASHGSGAGTQLKTPMTPTITPPTPTDVSPSQLLPPPSSPTPTDHSMSSVRSNSAERSVMAPMSMTQPLDGRKAADAPPTPGNGSFNLSDFINVSPSPAASTGPSSRLGSMHVDIGRRLFEEHHGLNGAGGRAEGAAGAKNGLGAGIDLVKS